jgi:hypothetical protein
MSTTPSSAALTVIEPAFSEPEKLAVPDSWPGIQA